MRSTVYVQYEKNLSSFTAGQRWQWDHGITLLVSGDLEAASFRQVHFASENQRMSFDKELVLSSDGYKCSIPDELFMIPRNIHCYIYIGDEDTGMTTIDVLIPVVPRPKPSGYVQDNTMVADYEEIYAKVNSLVDEAKVAQEAAEEAQKNAEEIAASVSPEAFVFQVNPEDGCLYLIDEE